MSALDGKYCQFLFWRRFPSEASFARLLWHRMWKIYPYCSTKEGKSTRGGRKYSIFEYKRGKTHRNGEFSVLWRSAVQWKRGNGGGVGGRIALSVAICGREKESRFAGISLRGSGRTKRRVKRRVKGRGGGKSGNGAAKNGVTRGHGSAMAGWRYPVFLVQTSSFFVAKELFHGERRMLLPRGFRGLCCLFCHKTEKRAGEILSLLCCGSPGASPPAGKRGNAVI